MSNLPLVTAIMPTADYQKYIGVAISCFLRQTYPNKELVILDDGYSSSESYIPDNPLIKYTYQSPANGKWSTGRKRNFCCDRANGDIILHWDSDDWYADDRMEAQVERLVSCGKQVTGFHRILIWRCDTTTCHQAYAFEAMPPFAAGTSMCYFRSWQEAHPFVNSHIGEDSEFGHVAHRNGQLDSMDGGQLLVARAHVDSTQFPPLGTPQFPRLTVNDFPQAFFDACS